MVIAITSSSDSFISFSLLVDKPDKYRQNRWHIYLAIFDKTQFGLDKEEILFQMFNTPHFYLFHNVSKSESESEILMLRKIVGQAAKVLLFHSGLLTY